MKNSLFNLTPPDGEEVDGTVTVRPNVWLLTSDDVAPLLLSVNSAARCLGVDVDEIGHLVGNGDLAGVEVGGQAAIQAASLGTYVAGLELKSADPSTKAHGRL